MGIRNTKKLWAALYLAGTSLALGSLSGCQTQVAGMTLPSGWYLQHPPQYIQPTPYFPLSRETARLDEVSSIPCGNCNTPQQLPPPVPGGGGYQQLPPPVPGGAGYDQAPFQGGPGFQGQPMPNRGPGGFQGQPIPNMGGPGGPGNVGPGAGQPFPGGNPNGLN